MDIKSIVNEIKSKNVNEVAIPVGLSNADNIEVSVDEISVPMYQCVDPSVIMHAGMHQEVERYEKTGTCCCDDFNDCGDCCI